MSVPGQTVGVSVFTDTLIEILGISRFHLSTCYMLGTISSALLLPRAGRLYDRIGARAFAPIASACLGATLIVLSFLDHILASLIYIFPALRNILPFVLIYLGFLSLRFFGQGTLTLVSRNMAMKWFVARRGLVNGILGVCIAVGFSLLTYYINVLLGLYGWSAAWQIVGLFLIFGFSIFALIFYRDTPDSCGLLVDGGRKPEKGVSLTGVLSPDATLRDAQTFYDFWIHCVGLALPALSVTAVSFHIVSIFGIAGMSRDAAIGVYVPAAIVSSIGVLAGGWLSDRIKLKWLLLTLAFSQMLLMGGLLFLHLSGGLFFVIFGLGISQAMFGTLIGVVWPRLFGLLHLGEISGFASASAVVGSAVGPLLFSLSEKVGGDYSAAAIFCGILSVILAVASLKGEA